MHAKYCGREISVNEMQNIVTTDPYLGFPEACHLFFSSKKFFAMGHAFFTSPTKLFQNEINFLKRSGNTDIDSAIKYCVLVCLMMDFARKDSFSKNICREAHKSDDPSNNCENITSSVIEYFYQSLYKKTIMITNDELHETCKELTKTYIKNKINSNTYVFQHQTVFEAVLYSYWHNNTMADVIKDFKADILAEHFRPFDSILKGFKKFIIVPENQCTDLAHKLFETFLANFNEFCKCYSLIIESKFILNLFNLKLEEWFTKQEHILKCDWIIIWIFIRPFNYKKENDIICAKANDKYLTQRLSNELDNRKLRVNRYIEKYGDAKFLDKCIQKIAEWYQSEEISLNRNWNLIDYIFRPTTFKMKSGQIGTVVTNDGWLIQRLINRLMDTISHKEIGERTYEVYKYIERYGSETFVKNFNEKLAKCFQSEESVLNCHWKMIDSFIRPKSFPIESGQIGIVAENDGWLIQRLINRLVDTISHKEIGKRTYEVNKYIERYGSETFVKYFNEKLAKCFQSEESVLNCHWKVIDSFIRPKSFTIENGQIGTATNDDWLIQRLINILMKPDDVRARSIEKYIKKYGCEQFVNSFNGKLAEFILSEEDIVKCNLHLFCTFVRPQSCLGFEKIRILVQDERVIIYLFSKLEQPTNVYTVKWYISEYGSDEFKTKFNEQLKEKVEMHDILDQNCKWECLELFFDNVASSEASDIDNILEDSDIDIGNVSDMYSGISIDTNNTESDPNIDVDSSNNSEGSDNETNHSSNNNDNNGVLVMME